MNRLKQLKASIDVLAANPDDQIAFLISIGHAAEQRQLPDNANVDEIALQFEDAAYATLGLVREGRISEAAGDRIAKLGSELVAYSGAEEEELWTVKALKADARWARIRELASQAAALIEGV